MSNYAPKLPNGWQAHPAPVGYDFTHREYEAETIDGREVGNGLACWALTREDGIRQIREIEAEHPYFAECETCGKAA